ncbi:Protein ECM13 [Cytospora mali]|uniref:Protein ECM13 n=1 Tax=Cytospora mali TaxID=578113 RepID=A0A194URX1_CYTMA|nr:Protein ECM13 [Valsa mali var. pyri (nom. inval.)]
MSSFTTTTSTTTTSPSPILASPIKKKTMSLTQTYYLAHKARAKLSHEAAMPDHNLRLLVGHANLLDSLMLELADAEREQESWFNQSVRNAQQQPEKTADDKHIQWADTIVEEDDEDDEDDYSDASSDEEDSDFDEDEDVEMADVISLRRVPSHYHVAAPSSPKMEVVEVEMEDEEEEEDYAELTLTRSPSHTLASSPPELEHDSDESSEDESMPPSPPSAVLPTFDERQSKESSIATTTDFYEEGFYLPARNPTRLVSQISVY